MKKQRLVIISHAYVVSGYRQKIQEIAQHSNYEVHLIIPTFSIESGDQKVYAQNKEQSLESVDYTIHVLDSFFTGKPNTYFFKGLGFLLRKIKPDIIHLEEEYWTNCALQVVLIKQLFLKETKLLLLSEENICHMWGQEGQTLYQKLRFAVFNLIEKIVLPKLDGLGLQFEYLQSEFSQKFSQQGFKGLLFFVPQLGVDQARFKVIDEAELMELKVESGLISVKKGIISKKFVFGYVGRIIPEKGLEDLLKAFNLISKDNYLRLLIVGNGSKEYIDYLQKLAKQQTNTNGKVVFLPAVPYKKVPLILKLMDVMMLPSKTTPEWKEQFGRTLVEAMLCEVPILASNSGAIPYVIGEAGVLFQEGDIQDLSQKMNMLQQKDTLRVSLAQKGLERIEQCYSYKTIAQKHIEIFNLF